MHHACMPHHRAMSACHVTTHDMMLHFNASMDTKVASHKGKDMTTQGQGQCSQLMSIFLHLRQDISFMERISQGQLPRAPSHPFLDPKWLQETFENFMKRNLTSNHQTKS